MKTNTYKNCLSEGNIKLKGDEETAFLIFNLPSEITCPQSTAMCRKYCYAKKAERLYPQVLPFREANKAIVDRRLLLETVASAIDYKLALKRYKGKKVYFRWHESGDVYDRIQWIDMVILARWYPDITFLVYTKSLHIIQDEVESGLPSNLMVKFSVWADTPQEDIEKAKKLGLSFFIAQRKDIPKKANIPTCGGDCQKCKMCYYGNYNIYCDIH